MIRIYGFIFFCIIASMSFGQVDQDTTLQSKIEDVNISSTRVYENGTTTLSRKQFLTMAGALEDPTRLLIKSPGISTANDQANSVIYHGLPAQYHQWSLYGARVLNPNHNANAGTISDLPSSSAGGVNMLSGQVIGSLEFNGSPSEKSLGSLAGMSDVRLRNPYKSGLTTNLSLIGLEAGYDLAKEDDNFMVNYRYSTVGILTSGLGLDFGGEEINYQDLTSKYSIKRKSGDYSFYVSLGANSNRKAALDSSLVTEFKDLQEVDYTSKILLGGVHHRYKNDRREINTTINVSRRVVDKFTEANIPITSTIRYENRGTMISLNHNNTRTFDKWKFGYQIESWLDDQFLLKEFPAEENGFLIERTIDQSSLSIQPTVNAGVELIENLSLNSTIGVLSNSMGTNDLDFIGHISLDYTINDFQVNLSASRAAQSQNIELALDSFSVDNQVIDNLSLNIKYRNTGVQFYRHHLGNLSNRDGAYNIIPLLNLDNLPIGYNHTMLFGVSNPVINGLTLFTSQDIYGVKLNSNLTFQASEVGYNGGIFSGYSSAPLDYGYLFNLRIQKEWKFQSDKAFGISTSFHGRGGETQMIVSESNSYDWGYTEYNQSSPPQLQLSDYYRADLRIYYKPSKRSTISLDIQNVTNRENDAYYYYEPLTGESTLKKQLGMIPILSWRVDW